MTLLRAFSLAALLGTIALPASALSIAIDPATGEPLANPPTIFLTLNDAAGEVVGDYTLEQFSFRVAPNPEFEDEQSDGRPRFTLFVTSMDATLMNWVLDEDTTRSLVVEILPREAEGTALTYTIEGITVHAVDGYLTTGEFEQSSVSLTISADDFSLAERDIQPIEN
ncbi:hypothetical protein [Pelagibacterium luteolum]|uniref:Type VI secretion system secreted protein Hcp n=1 Tax=Pelagibacterium luteolum TaxID=440168 RepID=A0A1G7SUE0_9HYPH|nr:hypothetical protein [Pelagibacterium luteolum]SDG26049.1 hypothetical protein SAMN04487974_101702 [Pelagibacterium luteolum]